MSLSSRSSSSGQSSGGRGGGGGGSDQTRGYYAYRHPTYTESENDPLNYIPVTMEDQQRGSEGGRKMGSVSVENGALNLRIPCAFSYDYDVPVPPQSSKKERLKSNKNKKAAQNKPPPQRIPKSSSASANVSQAFCATVKSGELYKAKHVCSTGSRTMNQCSVKWDFQGGGNVPFQAVDYGQELYEQAAQNLAKTLMEQKLAERTSSTMSEVEDNCFDFSKPGINSSRSTKKALEKALESLNKLPQEVESMLRKDKRFEPVVMSQATKTLNVSRNSKVFKDLIPVDPNPDVQTETENILQAEIKKSIKAARQPSRTKDPEPKLSEFQSNSYTKIRPSPAQTPPKPSSGINIPANHDFDTIQADERIQSESNRLDDS